MRNSVIINVLTSDPDDGVSFYRVWGPMKQLRINTDVQLISEPNINWRTMSNCDIIYMHNPYSAAHLHIIELAISQKVPVWVDYDDNLYEIPEWHYSYTKLAASNHKAYMLKIINLCTIITVSTEQLRLRLISLTNRDVILVENYLPFPYEPWPLEVQQPEPVFKVMWRGGKAHHIDVAAYLEIIEQFAANHSGSIEFHCIGEPSALFTLPAISAHAKVVIYPIMELTQYFKFLASHPAHIGIVPIYESEFSNCISNNAWKEFLHGGMLTVMPDWFYPGLPYNYTDRLSMLSKLEKLYSFYYEEKTQFHNQLIVERAIVELRKRDSISARIEVLYKLLKTNKRLAGIKYLLKK